MRGGTAVLERLIQPVVEGLGYEYVGIEHRPHNPGALVRVYIDSENGIGVDDCALVSHQVSGVLDVEDPIAGAYTLEVSSPGLDRPLFTLEHFRRFSGSRVHLRLGHAIQGRRKFTGELLGVDGEDVLLRCDDEEYRLPHRAIERAHVVPEH